MSTANSHNWDRLARRICLSLAMFLAAAGGPIVFRGVQTAIQNAEVATSQFLNQLDREIAWRLGHGGV